ncbi:TM2 domain-containing protein [Persicobacter psychrovividus]|uniref:TM2 domain-containing protein n=1 Tax=Persicobacter psychrovividus TaxID=387638 RepID=A0ABM7VID9_9BACT|nr:hypothetical protein PEPS_29970 [Persicobacter psychrovividus]
MDTRIILESQVKRKAAAYLCWVLLGCHYAYLSNWKKQWLYWLTLGGFGLWALIDLFRIPQLVERHNKMIYANIECLELEEIEKELQLHQACTY